MDISGTHQPHQPRGTIMSDVDQVPAVPLRPAVFHILLALSMGDLHGLGIAEEVEVTTDGTIELGPGTLYRSLKEMAETGLIEDVPAPEEGSDPRRRYYGITEAGRRLVQVEATRLARLVEVARDRDLLPRTAG
jgi:DNA-binding PadR family transcriptional regulator